MWNSISMFLMRMNFPVKKRITFYRKMARSTDERARGMLTRRVLEKLIEIEQDNNRGKDTLTSKMYSKWLITLAEGKKKIGEVMAGYAPASELVQIYAAEKSSRICEGFRLALEIAKQQASYSKILKSSLTKPLISLLAAFGMLVMFFKQLVPSLANSVSDEKLSPISVFIKTLANSFNIWFPILIVLCVCLAIWIAWALPNYTGSARKTLDKLPIFSLYKLNIGCSFLYSLNSLMKSNVKQVDALELIQDFSSPYLNMVIDKILDQTDVDFGKALISIKMDFPNKEVINELALIAARGNITTVLPDIIHSLSEDGLELIQGQAHIMEMLSMALSGGVLILFVTGLFSFISDLVSTVSF